MVRQNLHNGSQVEFNAQLTLLSNTILMQGLIKFKLMSEGYKLSVVL